MIVLRRSDEKPVLIGQAPSRATDGQPPFSGRSGARLAELAGVPRGELGSYFELRNLLPRFPGRSGGKGDAFPKAEARFRASLVAPGFLGRDVIFVGRAVADAFGFAAPPLRWRPYVFEEDGAPPGAYYFMAALLPHPSGVNLWWNEPKNVEAARRFLRRLVERRSE